MDQIETIKFNIPYFPKNKIQQINDLTSDTSLYLHRCETKLSSIYKNPIHLTLNCSSAIFASLLILELKPGDEVILPSFTFVTVANSLVILGLKPVYADVKAHTMNLDPEDLSKKITSKTKAVIFMEYGGNSEGIWEIKHICEKRNLPLIEDAAYGFNLSDPERNKPLGTIGDLGCISLDKTKPYHCGQGGILVINNPKYVQKAAHVIDLGTNRAEHFQGKIDHYHWLTPGFKFQINELNLPLLETIIDQSTEIKNSLQEIFDLYSDELNDLTQIEIPASFSNHFYLKTQSEKERNELKSFLKNRKIESFSHYEPLHLSPFGQQFYRATLNYTEKEASRILRLPFYPFMSGQHVIIEAIKKGLS